VPEIDRAAEVLRRVSNFLMTLTDDQVDDLIAGQVRITLTPGSRKKSHSRPLSIAGSDVSRIRAELQSKATREEGITFLDSLVLTRESLRVIAVALDLPTPRTDTVAKLKDRIIDATIGYRLRSDAIRSRD